MSDVLLEGYVLFTQQSEKKTSRSFDLSRRFA